jgi:hypothetical protein
MIEVTKQRTKAVAAFLVSAFALMASFGVMAPEVLNTENIENLIYTVGGFATMIGLVVERLPNKGTAGWP